MKAQDLLSIASVQNVNLDSLYWTDYETWLSQNHVKLFEIVQKEIADMAWAEWASPETAFERWLARRIIGNFWHGNLANVKYGLFVSEFCRAVSKKYYTLMIQYQSELLQQQENN